jgi:hypothetical protein
MPVVDPDAVELTQEQMAELRAVVNSREVPAVVAELVARRFRWPSR